MGAIFLIVYVLPCFDGFNALFLTLLIEPSWTWSRSQVNPFKWTYSLACLTKIFVKCYGYIVRGAQISDGILKFASVIWRGLVSESIADIIKIGRRPYLFIVGIPVVRGLLCFLHALSHVIAFNCKGYGNMVWFRQFGMNHKVSDKF